MAVDMNMAYELLLARLDRAGLAIPDAQAAYYFRRTEAAAEELQKKGVVLDDGANDCMLVADLAAWRIQNRDKAEGEPQWLRYAIRERWIQQRKVEVNGDAP